MFGVVLLRRMAARPTYQIGHKRYRIDSCEPQKEAARKGKIEFHALTKGHYPGTLMSREILPGLNSIGFWDANTSQDWGLDAHRNEGIKVVFCETGTCDLVIGRKTYHLQADIFSSRARGCFINSAHPTSGGDGCTG